MSRREGKNIVVVRIRRGKRVVSLVRGGEIKLHHWQRENDRIVLGVRKDTGKSQVRGRNIAVSQRGRK